MTETPQALPDNPIKSIRQVGNQLHVHFSVGQMVCLPSTNGMFIPVNASGAPGTGDSSGAYANALSNPSFESGTTGWNTTTSITLDTTKGVYHGTASLKIDATAAQRIMTRSSASMVSVSAGEVWTLSAYVQGSGQARLRALDGSTTLAGTTYTPMLTLDGSVQRMTLTVTIPAGVTGIRPGVTLEVGSVGWVDAFMVAKTSNTSVPFVDYGESEAPQASINDYPYAAKPIGVASPWLFYYRECVDFCCWRVRERSRHSSFTNYYRGVRWGNGNNWDNAGRQAGFRVDTTPAVGSVAYRNVGTWGHVAWVNKVYANGSFRVEEYNWGSPDHEYGVRDSVTLASGAFDGFIHFEDSTP